ncbi:unnamed protein product [Pleuronectes platessa]|uniref:Uncharacterized protein n=1 Tax=Pleuronectes platessa TaxID=8262 RepID=A0A9N7VUM9_PLEPL|nr:unnamed protein product [Pleuronectes platessa]
MLWCADPIMSLRELVLPFVALRGNVIRAQRLLTCSAGPGSALVWSGFSQFGDSCGSEGSAEQISCPPPSSPNLLVSGFAVSHLGSPPGDGEEAGGQKRTGGGGQTDVEGQSCGQMGRQTTAEPDRGQGSNWH